MGHYHTVAQGETIRSLGDTYGCPPDDIWSAPENSQLRSDREPNVLAPGDQAWIPCDDTRTVPQMSRAPARTGQRYAFVSGASHRIRVKWLNHAAEPLDQWKYQIRYPGGHTSGNLTSGGVMSTRVPVTARNLSIRLEANSTPEREILIQSGIMTDAGPREQKLTAQLSVGTLDPVSTTTGCLQRLTNLGYYCDSIDIEPRQDSPVTRRLRAAVRRFQSDSNIDVNGQLDEATKSALHRWHQSADGMTLSCRNAGYLNPADPYHISPDALNQIRVPSYLQRKGISGSGMFLKNNLSRWFPIEDAVDALDWCCIPFIQWNRALMNDAAPDTEYINSLRSQGVTITGYDWLPKPSNWEENLERALVRTLDVGGIGFVLDAEKEFKDSERNPDQDIVVREAREYCRTVRAMCEQYDLWLGFTSFSLPGNHSSLQWDTFYEFCDVGVPQGYNRMNYGHPTAIPENVRHRDQAYPYDRILDENYEHGARAMALGRGGYDYWQGRWKTEEVFRRHMNNTPDWAESVVVWPASSEAPGYVFEQLRDWNPWYIANG